MKEKESVENESSIFQRAADVEEIPWGKRIALYHSEMEKVAVLNSTGSILWKQLETPQSRQQLAQHLKTQFPALSQDQLEQDVTGYLQELIGKKCIECANES